MSSILELSNEILIPLIVKQLTIEANNYKSSDDYFKCELENNQLIIEGVNYIVYGNSCWEDSKEETKYTTFNSFDSSKIGEFFNSLLIDEQTIHDKFNNHPDYLFHLDNFIPDYNFNRFVNEDSRQENVDYYYNYDEVKILKLDICEVLDSLRILPFQKDISECHNVFSNISKEDLNSIYLYNKINENLSEKSINIKKRKI